MDVTDQSSIARAVQSVVRDFGKIDVVVQCAGITGKMGLKAHEVDPADYERVLKVNLFGIIYMCMEVIPIMLRRNYGRYV